MPVLVKCRECRVQCREKKIAVQRRKNPVLPPRYFFFHIQHSNMASHDLHFQVTQNGVEDPAALHPATPGGFPQQQQEDGGGILGQTLAQSAHPVVAIFHFLFKSCALFLYIFGGWFSGSSKKNSGANFITVTVFCILFLAADFWVVKNITGRLLVGLRWWNKVDGDKTSWIFESSKDRSVNKFDSSVFWTGLYATPVVWSALLVVGILKFNLGWLVVVATALATSSANVYGYYKCSSDQKAKFQQMMTQGAQAGAMTVMRSNVLGWLTGGSNTPQGQPQQQQQNTFV